MTLDLTKPLKTRDGRAVHIYAVLPDAAYPIHGRIEEGEPISWTRDGRFVPDGKFGEDLVNTPQTFPVEVYVAMHDDGSYVTFSAGDRHYAKERALAYFNDPIEPRAVAIKRITAEVTEGETLDG